MARMTIPANNAAAQALNKRTGRRVRNLLFGRMTQAELAAAIGTTQSGMSRRIRGITEFTPYELVITARALGVTVDILLSDSQPPDYKAAVSRIVNATELSTRAYATAA